jgi:GR25 family glycosyltransferase involved in LPS biosynthesis
MLDQRIAQVLVVSLPQDTERRQYIKKHFAELNINEYTFVNGVDHKSDAVKQLYLANRVKAFPVCFRCGKSKCQCGNNILIPQQVANWLAFKKAWVKASVNTELTLICEDDVVFYPGAMEWLTKALDKIDTSTEEPLLIRLAHSGLNSQVSLQNLEGITLTPKVVMSNVAFIINQAMATLLLSQFSHINTTSDIFIHNEIASLESVNAYTIEPLLATDLSFDKNYAKFASRIHPKGIDEEDKKRMKAHIKRVESEQEYKKVLVKWLSN